MKVMILGKATSEAEAGVPPDPQALEAMHNYNEALIAAGILKDQILGGLKPTRFAKRVHFSGKNRTVIDGPFTETKEVVTGFSMWDVTSIEEAIEWVRKAPMTAECDVDIRPLFSPEDFAPRGLQSQAAGSASKAALTTAQSTASRRRVMKVMVFVKATPDSEAEVPPDPGMINAMHAYNEALIAAGILQDQILGGLKPTRYAKRVHFSGKDRTVIDGPFAETKEMIAGFWLWEVQSIEEAVEWVKKCPNPMLTDSDVDIRPLYSPETWDPV